MNEIPDYDCGLINDFGGGDVSWWQDYIRAEIGRANDHWSEQAADALAAKDATIAELVEKLERTERNRDMWKGQVERQSAKISTMRDVLGRTLNHPLIRVTGDMEIAIREAMGVTNAQNAHVALDDRDQDYITHGLREEDLP